jgi:Domain of unknown function (DUF4333)
MSSRTRRIAVLLLAALAAACSRSLDAAGLEDQIATQLDQVFRGPTWTVVCPEGVKPHAGTTFACTATGDDGGSLTVRVTQVDDHGAVTWQVTGAG